MIFHKPAPTALPVLCQNQENAPMDSEIFQGWVFSEFIPSAEHFGNCFTHHRKQFLSLIMCHFILVRWNGQQGHFRDLSSS